LVKNGTTISTHTLSKNIEKTEKSL
jgi:Mg-chelatase subunit ChlD